jgi:hypothetical protein
MNKKKLKTQFPVVSLSWLDQVIDQVNSKLDQEKKTYKADCNSIKSLDDVKNLLTIFFAHMSLSNDSRAFSANELEIFSNLVTKGILKEF